MGVSIEARNIVVRRRLADRRSKLVLDDVSLRVDGGRIAVIEGGSGSGKSTLLRVLATLLAPTAGEVLLDEVPIDSLSPREVRTRVAFVAQNAPTTEGTVEANIALGPQLRGLQMSQESVLELMTRVGLAHDLVDRIAADLSGGERQRMVLARALANRPDIILLDEPTSALDPLSAERVTASVREVVEAGVGAIVVTHHREHARWFGGERYLCRDGKLRSVDA